MTAPLTFAEALTLVRAELGPYDDIAPDAFEDANGFAVLVAPIEYVETGDSDFLPINNAITFIDRYTGVVELVPVTEHFARLDKMTPVHVPRHPKAPRRRA